MERTEGFDRDRNDVVIYFWFVLAGEGLKDGNGYGSITISN